MKTAVQCLLVVVIVHTACSDIIEVDQIKESQGCSLSELPTYRNISCMDTKDKPVLTRSVMSVDTVCTFTCTNGVKTWAYCQNSEWSIHNKQCIPQEVTSLSQRPLVRKKRFIRFIFRLFKCLFSRCRRPRPRDRSIPSLHCPNDIHKTGDRKQTSTKVWWTKPQAHDARDGNVGTYSLYGHFSGQLFGEGYRTAGYYARDKSNNMARCYFSITITVTRCKKVHRVSNGYVRCHPSVDMVRGTVCRYGCYKGHELRGVSYSVCNDFGRWTGWTIVQPHCEKLTCPILIPTGRIAVQCSDNNKFRSICTLSCPEGYDIPQEHQRVRICQSDGSWSGRETYCKDIEKPTFKNCSSLYTFYVPKYEANTTVYWNIPEVDDNSGTTIHAVQTSGPLSHTVQPVGVYTVTFTATDTTGNKARDCQTKIIVKQIIQKLLREKKKALAIAFNSTFRYIDDVLSINNNHFNSYVDSIYPSELEIKYTTGSSTSASYLDILLKIDLSGKLTTQLYDKRDDFNFTIVSFPYLCSNIPSSPAYGVYVSQLIRYARACSAYDQFSNRETRCFMVYPTPYTVVNCTGNIYGSTCRFGCTNDAELQGSRFVSCETQGDPPYGYWTWGDVQPHCKLTERCPSLNAPRHGALSCDIWVGGKFCQMQCQEGYDVRDFPGLTVCSNDGHWNPEDNIKNCRKSSRSRTTKARIDIYYYTGKCSSESTQTQIKQNFILILQRSNLNKLCQAQSGCYWQMVKVVCGDADRKRSADDTVVQTEFIYETEVVNDETFKEIVNNHTANLKRLSEDIRSGNLNIKLDNETLQPSSIKENELNIGCENNTVPSLSTFSCVECTSGSYYDKLRGDCVDCPRGTFQAKAGQSECISCSEKLSTADVGTTSIDRCSDACPPGSWSANSLLPCTACDVGTYQSKYGATECFECSGGKLTNSDMSTTEDQCKEFDIVFPRNQTLGIDLHLQQLIFIEEFSITSRFQCLDKCNGTFFNIEEAGQSVISFELGNASAVSISGSKSEVTDTSVVDGQWHSVVLSKTKTHTLLLLDSKEYIHSSIADTVHFNISHIKLGESFEGVISQFNIFSNQTLIQDLRSFSEKCSNDDIGDILNWKYFKNAALNNAFIQIPSQCDDIDECSSSPCINGTCTDALLSYSCSCDIGYTGQNCDVDIDDCSVNSCQNNATCIDGTANYTCDCQPLYTGQFCEIEQVDGNWGEWGNWSECSVTCGNGSMTRSRACDSLAPDNGGQDCKGNDTEFGTCVMEECRVCSNLTEPDNSFLNCTETENVMHCTLTCDEGYDFDHAPPDSYTCGNETGHRWDFKSDDNSKTSLPPCSATEDGDKMEFKHTASYVNLRCSDHSNLKELILSKLTSAVQRLTCIKENICTKKEISVTNCNSKRRKRDTSITTGFYVVLQCLPKDHGTVTCYESLNEAAYEIQQLENNDTLTLSLDAVDYIVNTNTSEFDDVLACSLGSVAVYAYCVPCAPGRYFTNESCKLCDYGYYQDEFKQTSCKTCPAGLTTSGTGSTNSTDCNIPRSIVKEKEVSEEWDSSVISIAVGISVTVLLLSILSLGAVKRFKYVQEASTMSIVNSQPPISTNVVSLKYSSTKI